MTVRGPDEINIIPSEHPRHPVEINVPFAIGVNGVTFAEWMVCVDTGACSHTPKHYTLARVGHHELGPTHPVIYVS